MKYYFDRYDGRRWIPDEIGAGCFDEDEARQKAQEVLLEIAQAQLPDGLALTMMVRVKDDHGMIVDESSLEMHTI